MPTNITAEPAVSRLSERARTVPPSGIRRFFDIAATMDDVVSLGIGEPDFVSPQPIIDAAIESLRRGQTGYTANAGIYELRELITGELRRLYGVEYDPAGEIIVTVGVSEALQLAMLALLDPGDEILIPEPCFVSYGPTAIFAADLEPHITSNTKVLFLGYPNNPTGAVLRRETVEEIAELVIEHDLTVLSDEIYDRLIYGEAYDRGHVCVPSIEGLRERTILLGGFSKNYAMTGWRVGYVCAPKSILAGMYKLHQYIIMSAPTMAQYGAIAAIEQCQDDVERMRRSYNERRRFIVDGLRSAGLPTFEPEGAFYCFPDIRPTGLTSEEFAQRLLDEEHVACVPGDAFGPSGSGYLRCSYATSMENLERAVEGITDFVRRLTG